MKILFLGLMSNVFSKKTLDVIRGSLIVLEKINSKNKFQFLTNHPSPSPNTIFNERLSQQRRDVRKENP